jgi:hypothetical protein
VNPSGGEQTTEGHLYPLAYGNFIWVDVGEFD